MINFRFIKVLKVLAFVIAGGFIFGSVVMLLWNWLIPGIFGGPEINFWQAIGVLALARILTGGFRGPWSGMHKHNHHHWRKRWKHKWENMSPEERERLREKYAHRCGKRTTDKTEG